VRDAVFPIETFEHTWKRSEYWAMVATRPPELAATPPFADLLDAAAALERSDPGAALDAWRALSIREPLRFEPWMGAGNSAVALGDLVAARDLFEAATQLAPAQGDAWNNLASVRRSLGDVPGAREAAAKALAIGGPHRETYEQTVREIGQSR
jgi:predicted Zn-dependent protease